MGRIGSKYPVGTSKLNETSRNRLYTHILEHDNWAIISAYTGHDENGNDLTERDNEIRNAKLKTDVRNMNKGYTELVSRWVCDGEAFDERSLFTSNISKEDALALGKKYNQCSIIYKDNDDNTCKEICTTPFEDNGRSYSVGDVVRTFKLDGNTPFNIKTAENIFARREGGPVSKQKNGSGIFTFTEMFEVNPPRPSYFRDESWTRIL